MEPYTFTYTIDGQTLTAMSYVGTFLLGVIVNIIYNRISSEFFDDDDGGPHYG